MNIKEVVCAVVGAVGGAVASAFGGWSAALTVLLICMGLDYVTGLIVAGVFHNSPKSPGGGLESKAGWKGLCRKVGTLVVVLAAHYVDALLGIAYVRDAVVIAFAVNELISILENAGLMGVPIPKVLTKAIDTLRNKEDEDSASD